MPANVDPIYAKQANNGRGNWTSSLTGNVKSDGAGAAIGTDMVKLFTAGANGAFVQKLRANPNASAAATATTATVLRIYISTVTSGATTRDNTFLWAEVACPAQTAAQTTTATYPLEIPLGFALEPNATILVSMHHAAAANTSWGFHVIGGDY